MIFSSGVAQLYKPKQSCGIISTMRHEHHDCHCGLKEQLKKFRAGKLSLLGGFLIIGHLLFHVAECLIIPAILVALNRHDVEAINELNQTDLQEITFTTELTELNRHHTNFLNALEYFRPLRRWDCV